MPGKADQFVAGKKRGTGAGLAVEQMGTTATVPPEPSPTASTVERVRFERLRRAAETRIYCPTRERHYTLSYEAKCPEHGDAAKAEIARIAAEVARGRWDHDRQGYVPWE